MCDQGVVIYKALGPGVVRPGAVLFDVPNYFAVVGGSSVGSSRVDCSREGDEAVLGSCPAPSKASTSKALGAHLVRQY